MQAITCDAAMSDDVLQAARAAISKHVAYAAGKWAPERWLNDLPAKQQPLVPLLMALLDAAQATAQAIADNSWDDSCPLERSLAEEMANQAYKLGADVINATQCPDASEWSMPSMTGKELV